MNSSWICLDASIVTRLCVPPVDDALKQQFEIWTASHKLIAPSLLYYETSNALYKYYRHGLMTKEVLQKASQVILNLPIDLISDAMLHTQALEIAAQYRLAASYDAHYLAVAKRFDSNLWTMDRKLYHSVGSSFHNIKLWS